MYTPSWAHLSHDLELVFSVHLHKLEICAQKVSSLRLFWEVITPSQPCCLRPPSVLCHYINFFTQKMRVG